MTQRTIWMNRTTSFNWKRPVVGIVRVESEISAQLKKLYPDSQYKECIWNGDEFVELTEQPTNLKLLTSSSELVSKNYLFTIVPKKIALLSFVHSFFSLMPQVFRPFINKVMVAIKPKLSSIYRLYVKRCEAKRSVLNQESSCNFVEHENINIKLNTPFKRGDVLVSLGLDWDYDFVRQFFNLRMNEGIKIITCCYDLIPVLYPQYCAANVANVFAAYFIELADASDHIVCISKQSQHDLNYFLNSTGACKVKTSVFELGDNVPCSNSVVTDQISELLNKKYIIFVSSIERRKNHEVIYRAYHRLCSEGKKEELPLLVFVGMHGWGVDDLMKDIELDPLVKGLIVQMNHVTDSELLCLYENALFSVFPSLYEGWGLPVGESLSLGKPVICSDQGSLSEVAGDLAIYLDPWNVDAWAREIYSLAVNDEKRNELVRKIKDQYMKRTWEQSGVQFKRVIDSLI
jgi:glycosyltransferase involved in cell wall biosynthesis